MKTQLFWLKKRFLQFVKLFAHADIPSERKHFGLGQFVLLLTLAPFVFNLTLFSIGDSGGVASQYLYPAERFQPLNHPSSVVVPGHSPDMVEYVDPKLCKVEVFRIEEMLRQPCKKYQAQIKEYEKQKNKLLAEPIEKPVLPPISIIKESQFSFNALLEKAAHISSWQIINDSIWLIGLLLIFPTVWLCIKRKRWGLLFFGLAIPTINYLLFLVAAVSESTQLFDSQLKSPIFAQIAFLWFLLNGRITSKPFIIAILVMSFAASLPALHYIQSWLDHRYLAEETFTVFRAQLPLLIFIAVSILGRLLVKGAKENLYLLQNLGWLASLKSALHTILLWIPMGLLAVPFFLMTEVVFPKHTITKLHEDEILDYGYEHNLLDNTLQSTARKADDTLYAWYVALERTKIEIRQKSDELDAVNLETSVMKHFNQIVPQTLKFKDVESGVPLIGWAIDIGIRKSQESTQDAFSSFHAKVTKNLGQFLRGQDKVFKQQILHPAKDKSLTASEDIYQQGKTTILATSREAQATLWWWINHLQALHQVFLLLFGFICVKSLLYVFARVSFNRNTESFITLGDTKTQSENTRLSEINATGQQYIIQSDIEKIFYISRRFQCRGKAPLFYIPQPFKAPIARLFSKSITMNKIILHQGDDPVSCSATQGIEFFEWSLEADETVIFDFKSFVGMSDSITLSTLISPRISSLLIGRMIYSQATGPGKLILITKGRAEITDGEQNSASLPPERIIAMQKESRLHVDSEIDVINIYASSAYIRLKSGSAIVDVDNQHGEHSGLTSFVKHFIFPG
ncbi:MAG: hypothetical protein ACKE8G_03135 [Methylophagaceae bacterium]